MPCGRACCRALPWRPAVREMERGRRAGGAAPGNPHHVWASLGVVVADAEHRCGESSVLAPRDLFSAPHFTERIWTTASPALQASAKTQRKARQALEMRPGAAILPTFASPMVPPTVPKPPFCDHKSGGGHRLEMEKGLQTAVSRLVTRVSFGSQKLINRAISGRSPLKIRFPVRGVRVQVPPSAPTFWLHRRGMGLSRFSLHVPRSAMFWPFLPTNADIETRFAGPKQQESVDVRVGDQALVGARSAPRYTRPPSS
jgi:hypothetical protein